MLLVHSLALASVVYGQPGAVGVVNGTYAAKAGSPEAGSTERFYSTVTNALKLAGVEFTTVGDEDVAAGKLAGAKVALFAYTPAWAPGEAKATVDFIGSGGKVVAFYTVAPEVRQALGTDVGAYTTSEGRAAFHEARLAKGAPDLLGLPASFVNGSWNIHASKPGREDCRVVYEWYDQDGKPTGQAALLVSDTGAYMTHVLTDTDLATKARMLLALLGHFLPDLWPQAAERAVAQAWDFDDFGSLAELEALVARAEERGLANDPGPALTRARDLWSRMQSAVKAGKYPEALDLLGAQRGAAADAYARCQPSTDSEMRAVWIHTAFGVGDWGWERSIRHLKEMGFNAILPNMLWGGVAYYDSDVLPVHESIAERGDQVAECALWCRRYGVELHVWKVNWNLSGRTPQSFVEQLRAEGRLQRDPEGKEVLWLCPSDDRNFELERASMVELAEKYDIAGIHFDYIRYPSMQGCYCDQCRSKFEERIGEKVQTWPSDVINGPHAQEWLQFRRDNIDRLVEAVSRDAHRARPEIEVSAAVFGYWESSRDSIGQDWVKWVREGWLDFVCPMDYIPSNSALASLVAKQVEWVGGRMPLYIGLGEWRLRDSAHLIHQINLTRELGADGFVLFHYDHPEITDRRMPDLRLGSTREDAVPPHDGPAVQWSLPEGLADAPEHTYLAESDVQVGVSLGADAALAGAVEMRSLDGRVLRSLGRLSPGEERELTVRARHDPFRLAVVARHAEGRLAFDRRSPILWTVSPEEHEARQAKSRPPVFEGQGLRIGVLEGGYGASSLLAALASKEGYQVKPLFALTDEMLAPCQVLILPQPRNPSALGPEAVLAVRKFLMQGGFALATHDAVGFRLCPVLVPEVCAGGTERVDEAQWKLARELPGETGLDVGRAYTHTFYDHILVSAGPNGEVVATDPAGRAVVVEGWFGKGRFCACGLGLGIGEENADVALSGPERGLLLGVLRAFAE